MDGLLCIAFILFFLGGVYLVTFYGLLKGEVYTCPSSSLLNSSLFFSFFLYTIRRGCFICPRACACSLGYILRLVHMFKYGHTFSGFVFSSFLCIFFSPTKEKEKNEFGFSVEEEEVRTGGGGV